MTHIELTQDGYDRLVASLGRERARLEEARALVALQLEETEKEDVGLALAQRDFIEIEQRVLELEESVERARIITGGTAGRVGIGALVTLRDTAAQRTLEVRLVTPHEVGTGHTSGTPSVSTESPVGTGLRGRAIGETFVVELRGRKVTYEVIAVSY